MAVSLPSTGAVFGDNSTQIAPFTTAMVAGQYISTAVYNTAGSFTWTRPSGCNRVIVQVQGGGGGGASYNESGGAGGYAEQAINLASDVTTVAVTVGGAGGAVGYYAAGGDGGTSSFGAYVSATGGYGCNRNASHTGGHGGVGVNGGLNLLGGSGTGHGNTGGREAVGVGASSFFGSSWKASHSTNTANLGHTNPGAGGTGGAMQNWVGSNGGPGIVIVRAYTQRI